MNNRADNAQKRRAGNDRMRFQTALRDLGSKGPRPWEGRIGMNAMQGMHASPFRLPRVLLELPSKRMAAGLATSVSNPVPAPHGRASDGGGRPLITGWDIRVVEWSQPEKNG